jgi:hypothetical protein
MEYVHNAQVVIITIETKDYVVSLIQYVRLAIKTLVHVRHAIKAILLVVHNVFLHPPFKFLIV